MIPKRVLVIEDDKKVMGAICEYLEDKGYIVQAVESKALGDSLVQKAIDSAKDWLPDLILCDLCLPKAEHGFKILDALRKPPTNRIPFMFLTAQEDHESLMEAFKKGALGYVYKSKTTNHLVDVMQALFQTVEGFFTDPATGLPGKTLLGNRLERHPKNRRLFLAIIRLNDFFLRSQAEGENDLISHAHTHLRQYDSKGDMFYLENGYFALLHFPNDHLDYDEYINALNQIIIKADSKGETRRFRLSIGADQYDPLTRNTDPIHLEQRARIALQNIEEGKDLRAYDPSLDNELRTGRKLLDLLPKALEGKGDGLSLVYQPKASLVTNKICGMEALLRWNHPNTGPVIPPKIVGSAKDLRISRSLDQWVLTRAFRQTKTWLDQGHSLTLAVNLSENQITEKFAKEVEAIALSENFPLANLELELAESIDYGDENVRKMVARFIHACKAFGSKVAVDDFGAMNAQPSILSDLEVHTVKIDKSYLGGSTTIVRGLIQIIKEMERICVAEGVEDQETLGLLRTHGCDQIQGYIFGKPLTFDDFSEFLSKGHSLV